MKAILEFRFADYPVVKIKPGNDEFKAFDGLVEIHFLALDIDTGRYELKPFISLNTSLRNMTADEAADWAECLHSAVGIASEIKPSPSSGLRPVSNEVWKWVNDWQQAHPAPAAEKAETK